MEDINKPTTDNTNNPTTPTDNPTEPKSLPTGDSPNKSLEEGEDSNKSLDEGEDPHKTLPTREHETKKINDNSGHENKANDKAYEEPKEVEVEAFNLDYFDKPEEAEPEVVNKANDLINGDLNYFDNWIEEAEDKKKQNKEQLETYLKSNVETGNQLAYTAEDATNAAQDLQNTKSSLSGALRENALLNVGTVTALNPIDRDIQGYVRDELPAGTYGNSTSKEEIKQKIIEKHPLTIPNISEEALNAWAETVASYNKEKQIREDLSNNGPTINSGITKAEELNLMNRAASDYSSLSDAEKEMVGKVADAVAANPNVLNQPLNPLEPSNSRNNRAITESNQRLRDNAAAVNEAREAERREAERARETPTETETPTTPTRTTPATSTTETETSETEAETEETTPTTETETSETEAETEETTPTTETDTETPTETPTTETETPTETPTTDEDVIAKADEAKAAYEEAKKREYEAMRGEADETEIAQLAAEAERLRQEWEEAEAEAAALRPREDGEDSAEEPRIGHGREDRELSKEETLPEWVGGDDPHTSSAGAYWAGAFGDENWSDKVPQKTAQGLINYANDHHDNPFAMFGMTALMDSGGYDALKAGKDVQEMIAAAKDVAGNTYEAIDFFKNGSVLDGIKSILSAGWSALKVFGNAFSAAWNVCKATFSFLKSVFAPVSSAVSNILNTINGYNSVKAMIRDMYGIENTDEVIGEIFGDNSETNTNQTPVNVLNKTGFSVKGGTVTDESGYNSGMKEKENEVVSDACKKVMLYFPYLRKGIL